MTQLLIRNANLVDGTGAPWYMANVAGCTPMTHSVSVPEVRTIDSPSHRIDFRLSRMELLSSAWGYDFLPRRDKLYRRYSIKGWALSCRCVQD